VVPQSVGALAERARTETATKATTARVNRGAVERGDRLACHTQEEIAELVGVPQRTVSDLLRETANWPKSAKFTFGPGGGDPSHWATG